jgi:hypothetical protein
MLGRGTSLLATVALFTFAVVSLAGEKAGKSEGPALPYEDWGACPFECCTYRDWTASAPTAVLKERRKRSPVAFQLQSGDQVRGITGVVVTSNPGRLEVLKPFTLGEKPNRTALVKKGDVLFLIHYTGEGYSLFWFNGHIYSDMLDEADRVDLNPPPGANYRTISKAQVAWWVKVRNADGRVGWTDQSGNFDHMDRCA